MKPIQMVDLKGQYEKIKPEVDKAIQNVIDTTAFINGPEVQLFEKELAAYTGATYCISCANGTDALQIAMMALDLQPGDEIIMPAFTYIATVETAALLKLKVVLVDVDPDTFNIDPLQIEKAITPKTKAIVPVHLYGQCADMERIIDIAQKHNLYVIEDVAQAIGALYTFTHKPQAQAGTMGTIGCTSFFPSKNLGCFGDGGALFTNDESLAKKIKMIANHGQPQKYIHEIIGVNSRLDTLQAALLRVKLQHLSSYSAARATAAAYYDQAIDATKYTVPVRNPSSTHVFHQYTIKVKNNSRDAVKELLQANGIPSMVYYPLPIPSQKAFAELGYTTGDFPVAEKLCAEVLSLPIHTELETEQLAYIVQTLNQL
jgi:UDP-2-acetamido-2-deoxy-ribo-hexuluronate aminotransferase